MEEKKRKKSKKKNRSAQSESLHEVAASSSSTQKQDHHCATRDLDPPAENGDTPGAKEEEETLDPEAPASDPRLREELSAAQQIARELKNALESETANSHALRLLLEDLKTSHATSQTSSQLLLKQLREEMAQLRESESHQKGKEVGLQGEIQHLREENFQLRAVQEHQEQREAFAHTEVQQLREDNVQLREDSSQLFKEVEEMKDTIERLLLERRQLTAKMVAMQTGMNQLEREAAIRTRVEDELAVATTPETSKRWLSWASSKDSVAEAAAVAEHSRIQMVAAATMVEKLVAENSALVEKVNEQSALIDRLTKKYSYVMELQSIESERDACLTPLADQVMVEENTEAQVREVSTVDDNVQSDKLQARMEVVPKTPPIDSSSVPECWGGNIADAGVVGDSDHIRQEVSKNFLHDPPPQTVNSEMPQDALMQGNNSKPFSDAPIMGAPIRLFTFITRYVSGADLVKAESSKF